MLLLFYEFLCQNFDFIIMKRCHAKMVSPEAGRPSPATPLRNSREEKTKIFFTKKLLHFQNNKMFASRLPNFDPIGHVTLVLGPKNRPKSLA